MLGLPCAAAGRGAAQGAVPRAPAARSMVDSLDLQCECLHHHAIAPSCRCCGAALRRALYARRWGARAFGPPAPLLQRLPGALWDVSGLTSLSYVDVRGLAPALFAFCTGGSEIRLQPAAPWYRGHSRAHIPQYEDFTPRHPTVPLNNGPGCVARRAARAHHLQHHPPPAAAPRSQNNNYPMCGCNCTLSMARNYN